MTKKQFAKKCKKYYRKITRILFRRPFIFIPAAFALVAVIVAICAVSCHHRKEADLKTDTISVSAETAPMLDGTKWVYDGNFLKYDDPAFISTTGIDVSEWNEEIDWTKVKEAGIEFVIARVGYRGYETGKFAFDSSLETNLKGAAQAGLKIGVYFVTQAINEAEAIEEAETVMDKVKDFDLEMPIYIDCEPNGGSDTRTDDLTAKEHTDNAIAFCKRVEESGYRGGVYTNESWMKNHLEAERLTDYDIWLANYSGYEDSAFSFNMLQYTEEGEVSGIEEMVDLNVRITPAN